MLYCTFAVKRYPCTELMCQVHYGFKNWEHYGLHLKTTVLKDHSFRLLTVQSTHFKKRPIPKRPHNSVLWVVSQEDRFKCSWLFVIMKDWAIDWLKLGQKHQLLDSCTLFFRYNKLLRVIKSSLNDLLKALKGLVVMSQSLEEMSNSLYNNQVPGMWAGKVSYSYQEVCFFHCCRVIKWVCPYIPTQTLEEA